MWNYRARQLTADNIIRRMRLSCSIPNIINTHPEYVTLIAFLPEQWLHERASMLRHTYSASLVSVEPCRGEKPIQRPLKIHVDM